LGGTFDAVIWDFGGVISTSPLEAFAEFEARKGLPAGFLRRVNSCNPDDNAWARLERHAISLVDFDEAFASECEALGRRVGGWEVLPLLAGAIRPAMVVALRRVKAAMKTACITNNFAASCGGEGRTGSVADQGITALHYPPEVMALFDVVLESARVGFRKPEPEIYRMATRALGVEPERCVFLDDLGTNLKPARAMGMYTIKVGDPALALAELSALLGLELTG
jgi:putative hydrolase of the HAD superfamily